MPALGAPDEEQLGKAASYPFQRFASDFSLLTDRYKIGNFTNMEIARALRPDTPTFGRAP